MNRAVLGGSVSIGEWKAVFNHIWLSDMMLYWAQSILSIAFFGYGKILFLRMFNGITIYNDII